jgi:transcription elongation GreA/GreB family factor
MSALKQQLYDLCREYISQRIDAVNKTIAEMQEEANSETKSSAGDKYETGREMMQQELNRELARLYELKKQQAALGFINPQQHSSVVSPGSLVYTDSGNYFISISAGQLDVPQRKFLAISAASPLGVKLLGQRKDAIIQFNDKEYLINDIE